MGPEEENKLTFAEAKRISEYAASMLKLFLEDCERDFLEKDAVLEFKFNVNPSGKKFYKIYFHLGGISCTLSDTSQIRNDISDTKASISGYSG